MRGVWLLFLLVLGTSADYGKKGRHGKRAQRDGVRRAIDQSQFLNSKSSSSSPAASSWKIGVTPQPMREYIHSFPEEPVLPFPLHKVTPNVTVQPDSDLVFYLHIPKTAGQTFHRVLGRTFRNCSLLDNTCRKRSDVKHVISRRVDFTYATQPEFQHFLQEPQDVSVAFSPVIAALGHVDSSIALALLPRRTVFLTMLRDPVERTRSMYDYMRSNADIVTQCLHAKHTGSLLYEDDKWVSSPSSPAPESLVAQCNDGKLVNKLYKFDEPNEFLQWQQQLWNRAAEKQRLVVLSPFHLYPSTTFLQFVEMLPGLQLDNYMVRALSGSTSGSFVPPDLQPRGDEALQLAKEFLKRIPFFGLTSRFEDSVKLFLWTFGLPWPEDWNATEFTFNLSKNKTVTEDPAETEKAIEVNRQDQDLYAFGLELFEKRLKLMEVARRKPHEDL